MAYEESGLENYGNLLRKCLDLLGKMVIYWKVSQSFR